MRWCGHQDADPDIPILKKAQAEYAKLQLPKNSVPVARCFTDGLRNQEWQLKKSGFLPISQNLGIQNV